MNKIYSIALLLPEDEHLEEITEPLSRHQVELEEFENVSEFLDKAASNPKEYDAVIVPMRLQDGSSGVGSAVQVKGEFSTGEIPLIMITYSHDKAVIQSLFELGADGVFVTPLEIETILLYIEALNRQREFWQERNSTGPSKIDSFSALLEIFDHMPRGVIFLDAELNLLHINSLAFKLIGDPELSANRKTINKILKKARDPEVPVLIAGTDGRELSTTVTPISSGETLIHTIIIEDLSELSHISEIHHTSQRTRTLTLLTAAASLTFLQKTGTGVIVSPLLRIEEFLKNESMTTSLNILSTSLLEFLDLIIDPNVVLKVDIREERPVAVLPSDAFQIIGHLLLYAVDFVAGKGEISVVAEEYTPGEGVVLTFIADTRRLSPINSSDYLESALSAEHLLNDAAPAGKLSFGLQAAQNIARAYRCEIEYRQPQENIIKLRVGFPLAQMG